MILRRIAEGIKNQDWFVVFVELMIVVVGIYLGLQVDDWNKGRQDRVEEQAYLERLYEDLDATIGEIQREIEQLDLWYQQAQKVVQVLKAGTLGDVSKEDFEYGLVVAVRSVIGIYELATVEEMVSSGRIGIIQNWDLRTAIARANIKVKNRQLFFETFSDRIDLLIIVLWTRIRLYKEPGNLDQRAEYDLAFLFEDKEFQNAFGNTVQNLWGSRLWLSFLKNDLEELRALVGKEIGKEEPQ